jgi:hypothetical protein
VVDAISGKKL